MILADFECPCGAIHEALIDWSEKERTCPKCGQTSRKIVSVSGVNTANQDSPWIRTVLEVVDKDSPAPHCREFLKDPTRRNYHRRMRGQRLRPMEPGEEKAFRRNEQTEHARRVEFCKRRHYDRKRLEIHS